MVALEGCLVKKKSGEEGAVCIEVGDLLSCALGRYVCVCVCTRAQCVFVLGNLTHAFSYAMC